MLIGGCDKDQIMQLIANSQLTDQRRAALQSHIAVQFAIEPHHSDRSQPI